MSDLKHGTKSAPSPTAVFSSTLRKYAIFAARRWWLLLTLALIGGGIGYWISSQKAATYVSYARMMVSGRIALPEGAVYSEELSNFYGTQIELMQSAEIRRRAAAQVESSRPELRPVAMQLAVTQQRGTSFFVLTAIGSEPQYCQAFLNAVMREYVTFKREMRDEASGIAVTSVTDQLLKLDKELQIGEEEIIAFQKKDNVVFLAEEGNSAGKYLIQLKQKLADLKTEFELLRLLDVDQNIARQRQQPNEQEKSPGQDAAMKDDSNKGPEGDYLAAKQQIQLLEADMERLGRFLRPKHPKMVDLASKIQQQHRMIELFRSLSIAQIQTRRAALGLQMQNLEGEIKEWETKALNLNQKIADYNQLKAKVDRSKSLSDRLLATVQSVDVNKSLGQDVVTIMERATAPTVSNSEIVKAVATGVVAGLILGLGILSLFALFDDRVSSVVEVQQAFDEDIVAQIPREPGDGQLDVINAKEKHPMFAEACKNLRSSLLFMPFEGQRPKTILVTSSVPDEGKSTISANLAITLADAGSRTLLIDGDLRKGHLHRFFDDRMVPGLAEVLRREIDVREAITITPQENLFFLPRGRMAADASELYLRDVTDDLLRQIYQDYDYIVVDSAPVLAKEDTASLAPKIDATLFVIRAGVASLRRSRTALDILHKRNVNVLGLIFNSAARSSPGYYYYESYGEQEEEPQTKG